MRLNAVFVGPHGQAYETQKPLYKMMNGVISQH